MELNQGDKFGDRYQLLSKLGEGGMGEVWKARDTRLDRDVALKVSKAEFTARFDREARAMASFSHNNICQIHDVGSNYIVMELIDGVQLTGPLPVENAVVYAGQILDALDAAHRKKFTHRDLKPANVMVMKSGNVKLLDFGLAKRLPVELSPDDETLSAAKGLTKDQGIVGTLQYMSPEQLQGKEADARSDIFAFGCVLYEMLGGKRAFSGSNTASLIVTIMEREPEPLQTTPPLDRVIRTCLEKDPDKRFQSAAEARRALDWSRETPPDAHQVRTGQASRKTPRSWALIAGVAALAAVAGVLMMVRRPRTPAAGSAKLTRVTDSGFVDGAIISPDGKYLAYSERHLRTGSPEYSLFVRQTSGGNPVRLIGPEPVLIAAAFSPASDALLFIRREGADRVLFQIPVLGGAPRRLIERANSAAFSPDGKQIAFSRSQGVPGSRSFSVLVANADGSGERSLARAAEPHSLASPKWSPDGRTIAFLSGLSQATTAESLVSTVSASGGAKTDLKIPGWKAVESFVWLDSGRGFLLTVEEEAAEMSAHHQVLEVSWPGGKVVRVTNDLSDHHGLTATADLSTLSVVDLVVSSKIWVGPLGHPDEARPINQGTSQGVRGVAWSMDGRLISGDFASTGWVMNADGSGLRPFTVDRRAVRFPDLCGPGPHFTFISSVNQKVGLYSGDPDPWLLFCFRNGDLGSMGRRPRGNSWQPLLRPGRLRPQRAPTTTLCARL